MEGGRRGKRKRERKCVKEDKVKRLFDYLESVRRRLIFFHTRKEKERERRDGKKRKGSAKDRSNGGRPWTKGHPAQLALFFKKKKKKKGKGKKKGKKRSSTVFAPCFGRAEFPPLRSEKRKKRGKEVQVQSIIFEPPSAGLLRVRPWKKEGKKKEEEGRQDQVKRLRPPFTRSKAVRHDLKKKERRKKKKNERLAPFACVRREGGRKDRSRGSVGESAFSLVFSLKKKNKRKRGKKERGGESSTDREFSEHEKRKREKGEQCIEHQAAALPPYLLPHTLSKKKNQKRGRETREGKNQVRVVSFSVKKKKGRKDEEKEEKSVARSLPAYNKRKKKEGD